jgi:alpha-galactosidase
MKNLDIAKDFKPPLRIFQLDDGYRQKTKDCTKTNKKFPSGLKQLATQVNDAGFIPGIWVAPFLTHTSDQATRENPHWILRDKKNKPVVAMWNPNWGIFRYAYAIDISRPDFQNYIIEIFETLYQYGFRFFKLDFLFAACLPGKYYQKDKTSLQILRNGLMGIRSAVKDSLILGCGCPVEAGIGIVDSMRVGNDVTPYWSNFIDRVIGRGFEQLSTKNCIRNTLTRSFMHNTLFKNDPDCLITRHSRNKLSHSERITLGNINALSGGPLMISDDLSSLEQSSMNLLNNIFKLQEDMLLTDRVFITPDIMDRTMPHIQVALGDNDAYIGIYNFSNTPETKTLNMSDIIPWEKYSLIDYYTKESLEISKNKLITPIIEKHGVKVYYANKIN